MKISERCQYTKSHEWAAFDADGAATVGLSDYAQDQLGDLVFVNLPQVGDPVTAGEVFADVESVKAVSDLYSPVTGVVAEVNEELLDHPEAINADPYGAWLIKVEEITDRGELLDPDAYGALVEAAQ